MRRKTDRLLTRVPDITIRDRAEVEAEEFGDEASEDGDSEVQRVPRKVSNPITNGDDCFILIYYTKGLWKKEAITAFGAKRWH